MYLKGKKGTLYIIKWCKFKCPVYAAQRTRMITNLSCLVPRVRHLQGNVGGRNKQLLELIIKGTGSDKTDLEVFSIVAKFIKDTQRFSDFFLQHSHVSSMFCFSVPPSPPHLLDDMRSYSQSQPLPTIFIYKINHTFWYIVKNYLFSFLFPVFTNDCICV